VKVSQHLSNTTDQNIVIDPSDYLCYICYKSHCSIIESLKATEGSDEALQQSITDWVDIYNNKSTDKLTKATLKAVLYVANHVVLGKAVLLPLVCKVFLTSDSPDYTDSANTTIETTEICATFTGRWLLHQLITYLNA